MKNEKVIHIAVVVAGIDEEYQNNIVSGINKSALEHNINISYFVAYGGLLKSHRFDVGEYSIYSMINFSEFDGVILMTNTICDPETKERVINKVTESGIPAVVFDCSDYPELYNVSINNGSAMTDIIKHVIEKHGARVINFISGPLTNPEAKARYNAFLDTMAEYNLPVENERIYFGEFRSQDGIEAIYEFLNSGLEMPDAFICANDAMALTAMSSLEKAGYRIPEDIIVTGFDYTYDARNFCPSLTSVKRPLVDMGYKSVETIIDILSGKNPPKNVSLESSPVFCESCGCIAENDDDYRQYKKRTFLKMQSINTGVTMVNKFTAGLAETEQIEETMDVLNKFIEELKCDKFCLCLVEDWLDSFGSITHEEGDYATYMTAPLIWEKGVRRECGFFSSSDMFPEKITTGGNINYFLPLHFRDCCLGYYIITNSDFPVHSLLCHNLTMNLSNSLENVRKLIHLRKTMDELNRLYVIDPLCNIYNRNGFINLADSRFRECAEKRQLVMLTFIDMDGLKFINDNYGHNEGDFAIQRLAGIIQECAPNSICARFGGDEFVVFSHNVKESDSEKFKRRFDAKIENINAIIKKPYMLSASIGSVVAVAEKDITLYSVIKQADEKMYEVKKQKKNSRRGSL